MSLQCGVALHLVDDASFIANSAIAQIYTTVFIYCYIVHLGSSFQITLSNSHCYVLPVHYATLMSRRFMNLSVTQLKMFRFILFCGPPYIPCGFARQLLQHHYTRTIYLLRHLQPRAHCVLWTSTLHLLCKLLVGHLVSTDCLVILLFFIKDLRKGMIVGFLQQFVTTNVYTEDRHSSQDI